MQSVVVEGLPSPVVIRDSSLLQGGNTVRKIVPVSQGYTLTQFLIRKREHYLFPDVAQHLKENTVWLSGSKVAVNKSTGRVRCFHGDTSQRECQAVEHAGVKRAMAQDYRMVGCHLIYIPASRAPLLSQIKLVIISAAQPFSRRGFFSPAMDSRFYVSNGANR